MFSLNDVGFLGSLQPPPTDPDFASVSLLLHGDGTNGSTTITDNSPSPKTVTAVGNAQISTAQSKFGGASIAFDGNGDYLTVPDNADFEFGSGNFTVEMWIYPTSGTNTFRCFVAKSNRNSGGGQGSFICQISNANKLQMLFDKDATGDTWDIDVQGTTTVALNTWHHIAVVRSGNVFTAYLNGVSEATATSSIALVDNAQLLVIGALGYTSPPFVSLFTGYIDELRITKGISRYNAAFTPPTAPFPDA
jgi:hypothetical protein